MTPADKRILDLLDRWLASIELHLKYAELDEASYRQVQPWPEHDRPARWILELSQQKILQLKTLSKAHIASNDTSFAESLELMCFLANLVGVQNIKRYIPLADPNREQPIKTVTDHEVTQEAALPAPDSPHDNATRELPRIKIKTTPAPPSAVEVDHTREMPKLKQPVRKPTPAATHQPVKRPPTKTASSAQAKQAEPASGDIAARISDVVVADAVRLLKWGREWHELTELIARMAERPSSAEVRRILRTHKASIEAQVQA
jgi:hypothetical protein